MQQTSRDNIAPNTLNRHQFANTGEKDAAEFTKQRGTAAPVERPRREMYELAVSNKCGVLEAPLQLYRTRDGVISPRLCTA